MAILQASSAPNLHKPPIGLPGLVAVALAMFCAPVAPDVGLLLWLTPTKLSTWSSTCRSSLALRMLMPSCNCAPVSPCGPRNASIVPLPIIHHMQVDQATQPLDKSETRFAGLL